MPTTENTTSHATYHRPTEAEAVAKIARENNEPRVVSLSGDGIAAQVLVVSKDHEVRDVRKLLEPYRKAPERRRGTAELYDLKSFVEHANRFKDAHSALFANPEGNGGGPTLTSVLDYHEGAAGGPRWGQHRGQLTFALSDEWEAWDAKNDTEMSQAEFAAFLERRLIDVRLPGAELAGRVRELADVLELTYASPKRLLELARGLSVHESSRVTNAVNVSTGEGKVSFETEHTQHGPAGESVTVPRAFIIGIPVFKHGPGYALPVLLRYRLRGSAIAWRYEIQGADLAFRDAFEEACTEAKEDTGLPLFVGSPEPSVTP